MATIFADIKTPFVNDATVKRVASAKVKENIFQNILTRPGEAVTEQFSTDVDAGEIQVIRVKPNNNEAREIGSDRNGSWFNGDDASESTTEAYGIKILDVIDYNIDIPANQQDMMRVDLAEAELTNLSGKVAKNVNALTIACQLAKNFNDVKAGSVADNKVTVTDGDYLSALIDAGSKLDDGNEAQGIDAYPDDWRAVFIRSKAKAELLKKGQIIIGGSNDAQTILRKGGFDTETSPDVAKTGYLGEVDNMPVYMTSKSIWAKAEQYMGLTKGALDNVEMLVVSGVGTGRALAFNSAIKIIDSPKGQGRRIQPKYRFGAECWDALSVVPCVNSSFTAPEGVITIKAPGSRA
jgi:hypothetical protein